MTLPEIKDDDETPQHQRPVVFTAVIGGGVCLLATIIAIAVIGAHTDTVGEVAVTGLVSIGATLAGGFAGWIARGRANS